MSDDPVLAKRPCASCPYRLDCPSGLWAAEEYALLPLFDLDTPSQPPAVFKCHQDNGRLCAGWVAVHDMDNCLGLRLAVADGTLTPDEAEAVRSYETDVPLHPSGFDAAKYGMRDLGSPSPETLRAARKIMRRRVLTGRPLDG